MVKLKMKTYILEEDEETTDYEESVLFKLVFIIRTYELNINVQVNIKKINKSEYWNSLYHHRDRVLVNSVLYWTWSPLRAENLPSIIFTFHFPDIKVELLPCQFYMYHIFKVVLSNLSFDPEQSLVKSFSRLDRKPAERKT